MLAPLRWSKLNELRRAVGGKPPRGTLSVGNRHHLRYVAACGWLFRNVPHPVEAPGIDPPGTLLPQQRVASVVEQLLDEQTVLARDHHCRGEQPSRMHPHGI